MPHCSDGDVTPPHPWEFWEFTLARPPVALPNVPVFVLHLIYLEGLFLGDCQVLKMLRPPGVGFDYF